MELEQLKMKHSKRKKKMTNAGDGKEVPEGEDDGDGVVKAGKKKAKAGAGRTANQSPD